MKRTDQEMGQRSRKLTELSLRDKVLKEKQQTWLPFAIVQPDRKQRSPAHPVTQWPTKKSDY